MNDALKALSRLHQSQYLVPPSTADEPYDDYMAETQQAPHSDVSPELPMMDDVDENPALKALRRLQAINSAAAAGASVDYEG